MAEVLYSNYPDGYKYEVKLPNGVRYWYEQSGNMGSGGGSPELTHRDIELAEKAIDQYEEIYGNSGPSRSGKSVGAGFFLILVGVFGAAFPYGMWYLQIGWRIRDSEPSDLALFANRALGVVLIIIGFIVIIQ